jgi:hypothetical protein
VTLTLRLFGSTEVEPMWTESFKGTTNGVVALEQEALGRLVGRLGLTVSGDEWTAIERLQEYRTALISAAVTGQIDVRQVSFRASAASPEASPK